MATVEELEKIIRDRQNDINNLNNTLNNERNSFNNQIQQKQNEIDQLNVNFGNERNSYSAQIQQKDNDINNLNNTLNNERNNFNNEKSSLTTQVQGLQNQINDLNNERNTFNNERNTFNNERNTATRDKESLNNEVRALKSEKDKLDERIADLTMNLDAERQNFSNEKKKYEIKIEELERVKEDLDRKVKEDAKSIVSALSDDYREYSNDIEKTSKIWMGATLLAFLAVIGFMVYAFITLKGNGDGYKIKSISRENREMVLILEDNTSNNTTSNYKERISNFIPYISLELVLISVLWFVINQYSYQRKLLTDYRNRKVVASSYLGVLNHIGDEKFKDESSRTITETLFSRSSIEMGNELPVKEAVKIFSSIANNKNMKG